MIEKKSLIEKYPNVFKAIKTLKKIQMTSRGGEDYLFIFFHPKI